MNAKELKKNWHDAVKANEENLSVETDIKSGLITNAMEVAKAIDSESGW